jgi:hypothetical protein
MTWQLVFVLNNLDLKTAFNSEYIAIVGSKDKRLIDFIAANPAAKPFVEGFRSTGGRKVSVSAVLLRDDAPADYKTTEAVYSLRNIFAMSSLIAGIQEQLRHEQNWVVTSSTFFDFYVGSSIVSKQRVCSRELANHALADNCCTARTFENEPELGLGNLAVAHCREQSVCQDLAKHFGVNSGELSHSALAVAVCLYKGPKRIGDLAGLFSQVFRQVLPQAVSNICGEVQETLALSFERFRNVAMSL